MWSKFLSVFNTDDAFLEYKEHVKSHTVYIPWHKKLLGYCPCCGKYFKYGIRTVRRITSYAEESNNWLTSCKKCRMEDFEYFAELLNNFHSDI